jgi:hypothetical protein
MTSGWVMIGKAVTVVRADLHNPYILQIICKEM